MVKGEKSSNAKDTPDKENEDLSQVKGISARFSMQEALVMNPDNYKSQTYKGH